MRALLPILPAAIQRRLECCPDERDAVQGPPTVAQTRAMACLLDHAPATIGQLASALSLSRPATTELIDRLAERGSVTREPSPRDRRQVLVALTPAARQATERIRAYRLARLTRLLSRLSPEHREGFARGMRVLAEELDAIHEAPRDPVRQPASTS